MPYALWDAIQWFPNGGWKMIAVFVIGAAMGFIVGRWGKA